MALQIAEAKTSREGTALTSFYVRVESKPLKCGIKIAIEYYHYSSKAAYQSGGITICNNQALQISYNRATDGADVDQFSHDSLVSYLTTSQGVDDNGDALPSAHALSNVAIVDL